MKLVKTRMAQVRRANPFSSVNRPGVQVARPSESTGRLRRFEVILWVVCLTTLAVVGNGIWKTTHGRSIGDIVDSVIKSTIIVVDPKGADPFPGRDAVTVLLLGTDATNNLCDTIIVAFIDLKAERVALMSVPRDSWMNIPGQGTDKVTHAFPNAMIHSKRIEDGITAVKGAVEQTLGIPIDRYVRVDIEGFRQVIDTIGGVEIDVEKKMYYTDNDQGLRIDLLPGRQTLDGDHALQYVRFRKDAQGDLGRIERQQKFLSAISSKLARMKNDQDITPLMAAGARMIQNTDTDMSLAEARALALLARSIDTAGVEKRVAAGYSATISDMSVYRLDLPQIQRDINELQRTVAKRPDALPERVAFVEVLNGCSVRGLADKTADYLEERDFRIATVGNADRWDYPATSITYAPGFDQTGARIAETLGVPATGLAENPLLAGADVDLQIVLGQGFELPPAS